MSQSEWVPTREAAAALGVGAGHIRWLVAHEHLVGELRGHRRWVRRDSLVRHVAERAGEASFVTYVEAAAIAGTAVSTVGAAVRRGDLSPREQSGTAHPSLRRTDVEAWVAERSRRRLELEEKAGRPPVSAPPDDGHVWLDPTTAGLVLGMSANGVRYRVARGLLPHVRCGVRVWLRRDHVEQAAAARALRGG